MENTELDKDRISAVEEQIRTLEFLWRISVAQMGPEFVEILIKNIDEIDLENEEAMGMIVLNALCTQCTLYSMHAICKYFTTLST